LEFASLFAFLLFSVFRVCASRRSFLRVEKSCRRWERRSFHGKARFERGIEADFADDFSFGLSKGDVLGAMGVFLEFWASGAVVEDEVIHCVMSGADEAKCPMEHHRFVGSTDMWGQRFRRGEVCSAGGLA